MNKEAVQLLLKSELESISDELVLNQLRTLLVEPRCELREWDYGEEGQKYPCWIVADHPPSNTCIAFCDQGFGPTCPWGLLFRTGEHQNMGMDSGWFANLEDAFRQSMAWDGEDPADYEVR